MEEARKESSALNGWACPVALADPQLALTLELLATPLFWRPQVFSLDVEGPWDMVAASPSVPQDPVAYRGTSTLLGPAAASGRLGTSAAGACSPASPALAAASPCPVVGLWLACLLLAHGHNFRSIRLASLPYATKPPTRPKHTH